MIDREFEQMSEEHMKNMTKPEGPAREAAKALFDVLDQYIIEFNTIEPQMNEAAIPVICAAMDAYARQQTAAKDALIDDLRRQRDLEWDSRKAAQSGRIAAERELAELRQSFEAEAERRFEYFCEHRMRAAERERDSLRVERGQLFHQQEALQKTVNMLSAENAALKAGKDGQP